MIKTEIKNQTSRPGYVGPIWMNFQTNLDHIEPYWIISTLLDHFGQVCNHSGPCCTIIGPVYLNHTFPTFLLFIFEFCLLIDFCLLINQFLLDFCLLLNFCLPLDFCLLDFCLLVFCPLDFCLLLDLCPEFLVRGQKKFGVNFGLKKICTTLYSFCVSLNF